MGNAKVSYILRNVSISVACFCSLILFSGVELSIRSFCFTSNKLVMAHVVPTRTIRFMLQSKFSEEKKPG